VTGPEALTHAEMAAALGEATGQAVVSVDVPEGAVRDVALRAGAPAWGAGPATADWDTLAATVAARLAPVCAGWPPEQFDALVADVVQFRLRWAAWDR
jgi:uncharacterized protein YbjT (DUF2867 family)